MLYNSNFDLLIFALIVLGYLAIDRNKNTLGLLLILFSALFKFYTIPLLLLFAFQIPQIRHRVMSIMFFILAVISAISDLRLMQEPIPSGGYAQFGFTIFAKYFEQVGIYLSPLLVMLLSTLIFGVSLISVLILSRALKLSEKSKKPITHSFFLVTATVFLSCYAAGLSYDPRLIYLTFAGYMILINMAKEFSRTLLTTLLLIASLLSCGLELGFIPQGEVGFHPIRVIQLINDVAIEIIAAILVIQVFRWFIQVLDWKSSNV